MIYLLYSTKPDIFFAIRQLSKYNADSQISHIKVAKKFVYYLKGIMHLSLIYSGHLKDEKEIKASIILFPFRLIRYRDSSYAGNPENKKSVMEYCYFINGVIIS